MAVDGLPLEKFAQMKGFKEGMKLGGKTDFLSAEDLKSFNSP